MANTSQSAALKFLSCARVLFGLAALLISARTLHAQLIFDVFAGHGLGVADSTVAEASWFPVTVEIQNDGPSFNAVVELTAGQFGNGPLRRVAVELPTRTKKRFTVPLYCPSRHRLSVDARLLNEKGNKVIAERLNLEARAVVDSQSPLIASLSRTHGGAAALPEGVGRNSPFKPAAVHLSPELFPDNPLTLESISMLYLHSARAMELKVPQVNSLLAWVHGGGHLVVGVEQPGDVKATPWLQSFLPCTLGEIAPHPSHSALQQWLQGTPDEAATIPVPTGRRQTTAQTVANPFKQLVPDATFQAASLPTVGALVRDGTALIGPAEAPLAVQAARGRGRVTVLLFSPELEPFRSWKNKNWFWANLGNVPMTWLASANTANYGFMPIDGIFGAMVDSKQIRKLPVGWLLLLLLAYLVVIGPLDQYWLKKINKQMLTWITFPSYVVLFSLLIYFIGYKLRSGEMEWNELHVVDVLPHGERADLRGRVYCSAYSPANAKYNVASEQGFSTLRGEAAAHSGSEVSTAVIDQRGNGFTGQLTVPVWTSQLFVNDFWKQAAPPLNMKVTPRADAFEVNIENLAGKKITKAQLIIEGRMYEIGEISGKKTFRVGRVGGLSLQPFVQTRVNNYNNVVQQRQNQFGGSESGRIADIFEGTLAASFIGLTVRSEAAEPQNNYTYYSRFISPPGFDLTELMQRGDAILIAWLPGETLTPKLNRFNPRYSRTDTILRVTVPLSK